MGGRCWLREREGGAERGRHPPDQVPASFYWKATTLEGYLALWPPGYRKVLSCQSCRNGGKQHILQCEQ
jgi:hypothetical protein